MFWIYVYVPGVCLGVHGDQKEGFSFLEMELQTVVSHCVGAGNRNQVLWKNSQWVFFLSELQSSFFYLDFFPQQVLADSSA